MEKRVLVFGLVVLLVLWSLSAAVGTVQAGCVARKVDCRIEGAKKVGSSNFSMCYSWALMDCKPCHGYAHLAKWCNKNVKECDGKCWGCYSREIYYIFQKACYDKHGNGHNLK